MSDFEWRAGCPDCGKTVDRSHHERWMNPFFLPDHCPRCGFTGDFIVELGRFGWVGSPLLPWTWRVVWQPKAQSQCVEGESE